MTRETEIRERAKELGYRLIKIPNTDRYNLAENSWRGQDLNQIEEKLEEIEEEMYRDEEEDEQPATLPAPPAVPPDSDLVERVRKCLWRYAAKEWWHHYVLKESSSFHGADCICPAMAYAWQRAIDLGFTKPVTGENETDLHFAVPDQEWIGIGMSEFDEDRYPARGACCGGTSDRKSDSTIWSRIATKRAHRTTPAAGGTRTTISRQLPGVHLSGQRPRSRSTRLGNGLPSAPARPVGSEMERRFDQTADGLVLH